MRFPDFTRRGAIGSAFAALAVLRGGAFGAPRTENPVSDRPWTLWYRAPAERWVEALPVGNGRLGAMVYGGAAHERLQLNDDTLWAGGPYDPSDPQVLEFLPQVRELIFEGRYKEAQDLANEKLMARPLRQMSYQTLGDLLIDIDDDGEAQDYRRWLDLDGAVAVTEWKTEKGAYRRTIYASAPDNVIVVTLETDGAPFDAQMRFTKDGGKADGARLLLSGRNGSQDGIAAALRFAAGVEAQSDGEISGKGETLRIRGAKRLTLLIAAHTSYINWRDVSGDPEANAGADLSAAAAVDEKTRLKRHQDDFRALFRGFDIELGDDPFPATPVNRRIRYSHEWGGDDPYLAALYVQYARYLLISSSRPGTQPANLQGIWNDSDTPPWGSKYTININTEMNYWPAEPLGLGDCVEPLIAMVEDLAESGARTAKTNYGARGWVAHHNTDLWRATAPIDGAFWGFWPMGGAWLCQHLWNRWDYSRDTAVLERIYPLMRGAGLFFLDTLVEHPDGSGLVTVPSNSPENAHHEGVSICAGPAMDRQILRYLFANIIEASEILDMDEDLRAEFAAARARLPEDRIGREGQLQEWLEDWDMDVPEIQHRHVSHLYALYPGDSIGPETPKLYDAARRSLEIRGDDATGWGIGWRINLWARLGNGARAYAVLRKLFGPDRTYPNLFDAHPPFQIDGNFGGAAGVIEMIVRDRSQAIELLPALPAQWSKGRIEGLRLRGGITLNLRWREGKVESAEFNSANAVKRPLIINGAKSELTLSPGKPFTWKP